MDKLQSTFRDIHHVAHEICQAIQASEIWRCDEIWVSKISQLQWNEILFEMPAEKPRCATKMPSISQTSNWLNELPYYVCRELQWGRSKGWRGGGGRRGAASTQENYENVKWGKAWRARRGVLHYTRSGLESKQSFNFLQWFLCAFVLQTHRPSPSPSPSPNPTHSDSQPAFKVYVCLFECVCVCVYGECLAS